MRNAETVLGVLRERGRRHWPLERVYRLLFSPELYLLAYGRIYSNKGAMTPGVTGETADGMSMEKIERIIDALRHERYRFSPVRRVYLPKKNGKLRPPGTPAWCDTSAGGRGRFGGSTSRKRTGNSARSACQHGRISWLARWSACCLRRTTNRSSPTALTVSVPAGDATPHCGKWLKPGPGQPGSSREISPTVSGASTMMLWSGFSRRAFTITGSSGLCATCFRPDTWKTGYGAPRSAGHRKAEWSPRFCPISTCTGWTTLSRES